MSIPSVEVAKVHWCAALFAARVGQAARCPSSYPTLLHALSALSDTALWFIPTCATALKALNLQIFPWLSKAQMHQSHQSITSELVLLFARRQRMRSTFMKSQDCIAEALEAQLQGFGEGPSDGDFDNFATALAASECADIRYLKVLARMAAGIINQAKASSIRSGSPRPS